MKKSLTCPKCDGRKILHVETMRLPHPAPGITSELLPMPIAMHKSAWSGLKAEGAFETFICHGCGHTEWYALAPETLVANETAGVHLIDNEPKATLR
jgi:predicted nucleic-acid-binding Zn-ribbon protein